MDNKRKSVWSQSIPLKQQWQIIRHLLHFAKPYKWYFYISIFFAAGISVVNILLPRILQDFMDKHLAVGNTQMKVMWFFAGLYLFGMFVKATMQFLQSYLYQMGAEYMLENTRRQLFSKLHTLGMRYFDTTPSGSIVSRLTNDTMTFSNFWQLFSSLIVALFAMVSSFIAMYVANAKIALWLLILMPILLVVIWFYQKYSTRIYRRMRERLSQLNNKLAESLTGISVIQQFRQEKRVNGEFQHTNNQYYDTRRAMIRVNSLLLSPMINLLYAIGTVMVLGFFGVKGLHAYVPAGLIYAFITYVQNFYQPLSQMMDNLSDFQNGIVAGLRVMRIMDDKTYEPKQNSGADQMVSEGKIEFKHVNFSYDGKKQILKDISFVAEPGQTVALVGETGSGKSSTINVLMRFYEYQSGQVLVDDHDIRDFSKKELRKKFGLVLQEPFMFYGTIASNIRMFNKNISDQQVEDAAKFVHADQFIQQLPGKYNAKVIERGASYSGGQKQLLSFARTVVNNPKVLVLDEATANIDTETEKEIQAGLDNIRKGRTTIVIAHRLSTIQNADLILVMHNGHIVERGNNDELLKKHGYYYDMIQMQNNS